MMQDGLDMLRLVLTLFVIAVSGIPSANGVFAQEVRIINLEVKERHISVPDETIRVNEGETVELHIASDEAGELHLHGYDVKIRLEADKTTVTVVETNVAGRFPITAHGFGTSGDHGHDQAHKALLYLEVYPR